MTTTETELRYRGGLLGIHPTLAAANDHKAKHHADIEDQSELTTEPARPVRLFCRGNLVETFLTTEGAQAYVARHVLKNRRAPAAAWLAVDTTKLAGKSLDQVLGEHARALDAPPAPPAPPAAEHDATATAPHAAVLEHDAAAVLEPHESPAPHGAESLAASSGSVAATTSAATSRATTSAAGAGAHASTTPAPPTTPEPPPTGR